MRGWQIERNGHEFIYSDNRTPTVGNRRPCGHCGLTDTLEGHDGCLGTLMGVVNACCGHGTPSEAYLQFPDGELRGIKALKWMMANVNC